VTGSTPDTIAPAARIDRQGNVMIISLNRPEEGPLAFAEKRAPAWKAR
jgi:hypothetical protein